MSATGGYYAYENGRWMYHGAQGQTRFASPQEVAGINARYPNGAPARLTEQDAAVPQSDGSGLVGGSPPAPAPAPFDTGSGSSYNPAPAPTAPTGNPPPAPTGGINGWNTAGVEKEPWWHTYASDPTTYRTISDPLVKAYYTNSDPQSAWWQFAQDTGYGTQFQNYLARNYEMYQSRYKQLAENNKDLQLPDFLTRGLGKEIYGEFQLQSPDQRGQNPRLYDPGRFNAQY